jgi:SAM-dependent methyltransferase
LKPDEIKRLYDAAYAAEYEAKFLTSPMTSLDASYELELLKGLLVSSASWLDVGCGTGYFMRRFPHVNRTGLDLSPAMLEIAKASNPGAEFVQQNYLDDRGDWAGKFDLVSCMWYAYSFVDTIADLQQLIKNLSSWTRSGGRCFVPLADPALISGYPLPYHLPDGGFAGEVTLTGIMWSFSEADGTKVHRHLVTPHPQFMVENFEKYFEKVTLIRYPPAVPGWTGRPAIIAEQKRNAG